MNERPVHNEVKPQAYKTWLLFCNSLFKYQMKGMAIRLSSFQLYVKFYFHFYNKIHKVLMN